MNKKFIFITGGVLSSLGKGIAAASIGTLLKQCGYSVTLIKMDPYINVDAGTMSPYEHGEVFITNDGAETDLDLGHYERYTGIAMTQYNNFTAGKIYHEVIAKERKGDFLGQTVQIIPQVTDQIRVSIEKAADNNEITIVEVGGTVGDIESLPFLEAIRQFQFSYSKNQIIYIHMTLLLHLSHSDEVKTKPTQHSVNKMREIGISPDIILCRCAHNFDDNIKKKISLFTQVPPERIIAASDVKNIYQVPLVFYKEKLHEQIFQLFGIKKVTHSFNNGKNIKKIMKTPQKTLQLLL